MGWLADTSLAVPALVRHHRAHAQAMQLTTARDVVLAAHSDLETYSVLTRLPGDARVAPSDASTLIAERFGEPATLPDPETVGLVHRLADLGVAGGATYDALIALTAEANGHVLLTRDARATATYSRLNVDYEVVG